MAKNEFADQIKSRNDVQVVEVEKGQDIANGIIESLRLRNDKNG